MLANPDIGVIQIAHRLGISPATLYRYLPAARTANTPGVCERPLYPKDRALHEGFSLKRAAACAESSRSLDHGPSPGLSRCQGLG